MSGGICHKNTLSDPRIEFPALRLMYMNVDNTLKTQGIRLLVTGIF